MTTDLKFPRPAVVNPLTALSSASLERLRSEMDAIDEKTLVPVNIDVNLAVSRALGVAPAVAAIRERIVRECPTADLHAIDQLEDRAYSLSYATALYESAVAPPNDFTDIVEEVMEARGVLLSVAKGLVACNLLDTEQIANINGGHGYRETAADAILLVSVLRANLTQLEGKMPFTREQLTRVEQAANRLTALVGIREQTPDRAADAANLQRRAYRLLDAAYSEVRRVVTYLRWSEDDAEAIAPPLRSRPITRKPADKPADGTSDATPPAAAAPVQQAKTEVVTTAPAPSAPAATAPTTPTAQKRANPYGAA
jgi:hypothetical protein